MNRITLKRTTTLKRRRKLKARKGLNQVSLKQKAKNEHWGEVTDERAREERNICQWCHLPGQRTSPKLYGYLDGHHIVKRRYNIYTKENCYIAHRFGCHREIEDNNVDVRIFPNRAVWLQMKE